MAATILRQEAHAGIDPIIGDHAQPLPLQQNEKGEALSFLAGRPLHTVYMASLIRDNGVQSPWNRGSLYSYRGSRGEIEGIALLGHATLIEAHSESAIKSFAQLARQSALPFLIRGETDLVRKFWIEYGASEQGASSVSSELLLEQVSTPRFKDVTGLRLATLSDLPHILKINSELAQAESGENPMRRDPEGFRARAARRISLGRNWVWIEDGKLLFKADIIAETPEMIYLEGIYVDPSERGKGYGTTCLSQLGRMLLRRSGSICLTLNARNQEMKNFYSKAGYEFRCYYDTIYLQTTH